MKWLTKWFRKEAPKKVSGAMHPILKAKAQRVKARTRGVGVVYRADGSPSITEDWLRNLTYQERMAAERNLAEHGWKINGNVVERII